MRPVWLAITTLAKEKLLLRKMNEGERYTAVWPRYHEIQNILKTQWIVRINLIINIFCQRRESEFCV
jgi:hypothetical protein